MLPTPNHDIDPPVVLLDAIKRQRRIQADLDLIDRLGKGPIPMVTAPWQPGPPRYAIHFRIEQPPIVHLWSHFESFSTREQMIDHWVVDRAALREEDEA